MAYDGRFSGKQISLYLKIWLCESVFRTYWAGERQCLDRALLLQSRAVSLDLLNISLEESILGGKGFRSHFYKCSYI